MRPTESLAVAAALMLNGGLLPASESLLNTLDASKTEAIARAHLGKPALVFTESRDNPIRHVNGIPAAWMSQLTKPRPSFEGIAQPGEFYVFQIGVYALADLGPIGIRFSPLRGPLGAIPTEGQQCLSIGGIDHLGRAFLKEILLEKGQLQALWIGVDVPAVAAGTHTGTAFVDVAPGRSVPVEITLHVQGPVLPDRGDSVAGKLSRLRWLNSTAGNTASLTQPFVAVQTKDRRITVLGRDLVLGDDGLPAQIESRFSASNTRLQQAGDSLLAGSMSFVVELADQNVSWRRSFGRLDRTDLEALWSARCTGGGMTADCSGRLDYTGSGEIRWRLTADRDLDIKDIRLEIPFREAAASFFMGLNKPGGKRPAEIRWKWNAAKHQDCFWMGEVNKGLMLRFKAADFLRPPVNIYYAFRPLRLPVSWGNEGRGGIDIEPPSNRRVLVRAFSGPRHLKKGDVLDFNFDIYLTPFRTLDTEKQWSVRFTHLGGIDRREVDSALAQADPKRGPNVVNVHHASFYAPFINYPYADASFPEFCKLVRQAHAKGVKLRVYYTAREITQNMPELFPLHSLNGEVILPGPGREARTLLHPNGPHAWLADNLVRDFIPAWEAQIGPPYGNLDLSVITTPDSRWNNFYLEGLRWLVDKSDFDGMYIDDTALDATSLRRARRILDSRPGRYIDLHTWNHFNEHAGFANNLALYMEILPYLDRLWLGEGFNASQAPWDFWLVEMSGLPFGLMSEMLEGPNPWRGMLFGETARLPWAGDPRALWKIWDDYGLAGTEMVGFFDPACPVESNQPDVKVTVYRKPGRAFLAVGSWANEDANVKLTFDWKALGLDPARASLYAPAIDKMQPERRWRPDDPIPVPKGRGWFLVLKD